MDSLPLSIFFLWLLIGIDIHGGAQQNDQSQVQSPRFAGVIIILHHWHRYTLHF